MIQVNLKLKLTKISKRIKVKYNTFEKATYDEYLISSLALRAHDEQEAYDYIDDITGNGSLNGHFKKLYEKVRTFNQEQLEKIMNSSLFPILKVDSSNVYEYYPEIDVSVFKKRVFNGDLAGYDNLLQQVLYINEDVIELSFEEGKRFDKPDSYLVTIDDIGNVKLKLYDKSISISSDMFKQLIFNELDAIKEYKGTIYKTAEGSGWQIVNNSVIKNLFSNKNYFYYKGDHCLIRNDNLRKTEMAQVSGLYIYREGYLSYDKDTEICESVLNVLHKNKSFDLLKPKALVVLLQNVNEDVAIQYINKDINGKYLSKEIAEFAIGLLEKDFANGWTVLTLQNLLKQCDKSGYSCIYKASSEVKFDIEQLIVIDSDLLTEEHRNQVEEYYNNLNSMKQTIRMIIGDITTSGLREAVKKLKSDAMTKKFTKLCNNLIGHEVDNLDKATYEQTVQWHKEAMELKNLSETISKRLN